MKTILYISGILGGLLLLISLIGTIINFKYNSLFFISGLALIVPTFIISAAIDKYNHNKKIKSIIKSYSEKPSVHDSMSADKSEIKGWSMNNSPYRERKSGLTWGGGNIKGANATRGTRKSFFK
ncbi:MAG TPA: hypothetical protein PL017_12685 [Tenuifilaceae bacterium]|nr:hypothetical protein [Tenuifilaceae bacterium]HPE18861.1 hypothetical protein [Tenuifilaceae bacterium]HPJ46946.1 hypothetical protein [Tenuifilaceae bacterium]HPQ35425.1 hypothetical protein [Tenuifilaceae bacterium]HRX69302.1 hypothetical protein [Tenuifilaceae bacterium]